IHAGRPRSEALTSLVQRFGHPGLQAMLGAIVHAEMSGAGIAGTLRAQTVQRTEERFARAERLAMESPVKMLGPLILCIFPCAFLVIGFPFAHCLLQWTWGGTMRERALLQNGRLREPCVLACETFLERA